MTDNKDVIHRLLQKVDVLQARNNALQREIDQLRSEIRSFSAPVDQQQQEIITETADVQAEPELHDPTPAEPETADRQSATWNIDPITPPQKKQDLEKFIGENLSNKIGIIITVLGVGIGVKYSIDHELISPLMRIILGYLVGGLLMFFAVRLKKKYTNFSAVLLSGAWAIMYFITYSAYSVYGYFGQLPAFLIMVALAALGVYSALHYNRQIIAHFGLVGAYAVPLLLSEGGGREEILFSYMGILNLAILAVAIKKYWISLHYSSFAITWLIFLIWLTDSYRPVSDIYSALLFPVLFYGIFYGMFLVRKVRDNKEFDAHDVLLVLTNALIFFAICYGVLSDHQKGARLLGLFTLINGVLHMSVALLMRMLAQPDRNFLRMLICLSILFIALAIPVQLDGNWVTLLWTGLGLALFWIGRTREPFYEWISYVLLFFATLSMGQDLAQVYASSPVSQLPFFNMSFLWSALFMLLFGSVLLVHHRKPLPESTDYTIRQSLDLALTGIFLLFLFFVLRREIGFFWPYPTEPEMMSELALDKISLFRKLTSLCYVLLFMTGLSIAIRRNKELQLPYTVFVLNIIGMLYFLTAGLYQLGDLKDLHIESYRDVSALSLLAWRYIALLCFFALAWMTRHLLLRFFPGSNNQYLFIFGLHLAIVWILTSELIHWLDLAGFSSSYKLGVSLLWGCYSLLLVVLGIMRELKPLRIAAIVLFGITLIKLFLYDIAQLSTLSKTVIFVSLGLLLLVMSYLYNRSRRRSEEEPA